MRYNIQSIMTQIDGVTIYDPTSIRWTEFEFTNGYYEHEINTHEILKPYLISYHYYGTVDYEDIILLINNIENIFEVPVGSAIKIPKIDDLKNFILKNKK